MNESAVPRRRYLGPFLMVILICLVYSNTFQASWHLDDYANIVYNQKLHPDRLSLSSLVDSLFASPTENGRLYRPVACLTFAVNWYVGKSNVFGYHVVNLLIHWLAAFFVLQTALLIFKTPMLTGRDGASAAPYWIALLSTTLWAIHPIQTQSVTYIVQRMASLAGLFYVVGLFCFLKGRLQEVRACAFFWYAGALLAYLLALGSKENAFIFPLALLLIEITLFRQDWFNNTRRRFLIASLVCATVLLGVITVLLINEEVMTSLLRAYEVRPFNHSERLLTQFRILLYYLFQIGYPSPAHLSVEHDIVVSSGLLTPWTTLPAMILIFGTLWSLIYFLPKTPLLSFGGLFFLLQHTVESSFLPLELIFEHRNYLPSMFLFTGVASGFYRLLFFYQNRNSLLHHILAGAGALILVFICMGAYSRNVDWLTEKSLWEDVLVKAPGSSRAYHNLAWGYYEPMGETEKALSLYQKAIQTPAHREDETSATLHNIGNIYYNIGDYDRAVEYLQRTVDQNPKRINSYQRLIHASIGNSDWHKAETTIDLLLARKVRPMETFRLKGFALLNQDNPAEAIGWFRRSIADGWVQWEELAGIGQSLHLLGHYAKSDFFLRSAQALAPDKLFLILNRLELYLDAGQVDKAEAMADQFVKTIQTGKIASAINRMATESSYYSLDYKHIIPQIEASLQKTLDEFKKEGTRMVLRLP